MAVAAVGVRHFHSRSECCSCSASAQRSGDRCNEGRCVTTKAIDNGVSGVSFDAVTELQCMYALLAYLIGECQREVNQRHFPQFTLVASLMLEKCVTEKCRLVLALEQHHSTAHITHHST